LISSFSCLKKGFVTKYILFGDCIQVQLHSEQCSLMMEEVIAIINCKYLITTKYTVCPLVHVPIIKELSFNCLFTVCLSLLPFCVKLEQFKHQQMAETKD